MSIERHSVHQILQNTAQTLSCQFYSGTNPVNPGTVTVTITDTDGNAVATDAATSGTGTDARTFDLTPANTASLTTLTAVWTTDAIGDLDANTKMTTYAEVVGDLLFTLAEARTFDNNKLQKVATYSDAAIIEARYRISQMIEDIIGYPLGKRYKREVLSGTGKTELLVPDIHVASVRSIEYRSHGEQTWTAYTADELADVLVEPYGLLVRESKGTFAKGRRNIRVGYEYGKDRYPLELREAALWLTAETVISSDIDPRAMSYSDGLGTIRYITPGLTRGAFTSIPHVNETLQRLSERVPVVG